MLIADCSSGGSIQFKGVTSGHEMRKVDKLYEGLNARAFCHFFGTHTLGNLQGGKFNSHYEGTRILFTDGLVAFIET